MNGNAKSYSDPYYLKRTFWFYLSLVLLLIFALSISISPPDLLMMLVGRTTFVAMCGSALTWVTYVANRPHPRLIMTLTLIAGVAAFLSGPLLNVLDMMAAIRNFPT